MNINNKIEIHRGVYFPQPSSSALSLNWTPGATTYANELACLVLGTSPVLMEPFSALNVAGALADRILQMEVLKAGGMYICYQGAEEPYNVPDVTPGTGVAGLSTFMKPSQLYIRLKDAFLTFDATRLIATYTLTINAASVGKPLYVHYDDTAGTGPIAVTVGSSTLAGDDIQFPFATITAVDTTSVVGATLVSIVC